MKKRHFSAMLITFIALFCLTDRAYAQYPHAFLYSNGVMTDLGTLGGVDSYAFGINDSGQIVGTSSTGYGQYHAFLYSNGVMTDLTPSYYYSGFSIRGINDSGQIVGEYQGQAVSWSEGVMTSLGSLVAIGKFSVATGINNSGQIIGDYEKASGAFLYSQGTVTDLGILPGYLRSHACGINDSGQIVGYSDRGYGQAHAFYTLTV
jgi:probable HAF family extracellular repeat protein